MMLPAVSNQKYKKKKDELVIAQKLDNVKLDNSFGKDSHLLNSVELKVDSSKNKFNLHYTEYGVFSNHDFPQRQKFTGEVWRNGVLQATEIDLHFTKVKFTDEPLKFPFNVSSRYTKK